MLEGGYDVLITGSLLILDEVNYVENAYLYIDNGVVVDYGRAPPPPDYEYATLVIGGENRVITPALGLPYTDAMLFHIHPSNRGTLTDRFHIMKKEPEEQLLRSLYTVLHELSLYGIGVVGVETPSPRITRKAEEVSKLTIVPIGCNDEHCIPIKSMGTKDVDDAIYIDKLEEIMVYKGNSAPVLTKRFSYNPCRLSAYEIYQTSRTAYSMRGQKWGIRKNVKALIAVYNFNDLPLYKAGLLDLFDLLRTCKRVETLIIGNEIVVDGGEHLTIGKTLIRRRG